MHLLDWFSGRRWPARPKGCRARHRQPLIVERLEDRCLLTSYSITDLGTFGGTLSYGEAINNRGQVAGEAFYGNGTRHPFLWSGDVLHDIAPAGESGAYHGNGINDLGQVVGDHDAHPFLWSKGVGETDFGFAGFAYDINNQGAVVGEISASAHAFLWKQGRRLDLGTLGSGTVSGAYGINNRSEVVGQAGARAFLWTATAGMKDLGSLDGDPGSTSGANAINDQGQIVGGSYSQALGTTHAAYFSPQGVIDLGTLGGLSDASAVNNLGQVVGDSYTASGDHAFITDLYGGPLVDLNTLIPPDSGWDHLFTADGINDAGQIVGTGQLPGYDIIHAYLLTPEDSQVAGLIPVATVPGQLQIIVAETYLTESQRGDHRPLPPIGETWAASAPPTQTSFVGQSAVPAPWSEPGPATDGWRDPLADVLAR